ADRARGGQCRWSGQTTRTALIGQLQVAGTTAGKLTHRFECFDRDVLSAPGAVPANALDGGIRLQLGGGGWLGGDGRGRRPCGGGGGRVGPSAVTASTRPPLVTTCPSTVAVPA